MWPRWVVSRPRNGRPIDLRQPDACRSSSLTNPDIVELRACATIDQIWVELALAATPTISTAAIVKMQTDFVNARNTILSVRWRFLSYQLQLGLLNATHAWWLSPLCADSLGKRKYNHQVRLSREKLKSSSFPRRLRLFGF